MGRQSGQWEAPLRRPFMESNRRRPAAHQAALAAVLEPPPATPSVPGLTSIIVIAHNRRELTTRCVESVLAHTRPPYELILVDNGSYDGTGQYFTALAHQHQQVRALTKDRNHGVYARTFGMQVARGETLCWLDNDVEVGEGWLEPLVAALGDPGVGGAGAEGVALTADWQHRFHTQGWSPDEARGKPVDILVGYCALFRNLTHFIGFLDPRFHPFWNEEADYSLRVKLLGYRLVVAPTNVIHHAHGTGLRLLPDRDAQIAEMNRRLIEKWEPFKHLVLDVCRG